MAKNPLKQYHDIDSKIKTLQADLKKAKALIIKSLESSKTGEITLGRYKATYTSYEQSRLNTDLLKDHLGADLHRYQTTVTCKSLKVGAV